MSAAFEVNSPESFGLFPDDEGYAEFDTNFPHSQHMPETYTGDIHAFGSNVTPESDTAIINHSSEE